MISDLIAHDYLHYWGNQEKQAYKPYAEICFMGHTSKTNVANLKTRAADRILK